MVYYMYITINIYIYMLIDDVIVIIIDVFRSAKKTYSMGQA